MDTVKIKNAVRPPAPSGRIVTEVSFRFNEKLDCILAKIEYGEVSGAETVNWRAMLDGPEAKAFATAWAKGKAAAVSKILAAGDLRSERH